jgi:hypothetical protein
MRRRSGVRCPISLKPSTCTERYDVYPSEPMIAKSITIKARGGRSGRRVAKAVVLTSGGLPGVLDSGLSNLQGLLIAVQESAAGIVCAGQRVVPEG